MGISQQQRAIIRKFKPYLLSVTPGAISTLQKILEDENDATVIDDVIKSIDKQKLKGALVDEVAIDTAWSLVQKLRYGETESGDTAVEATEVIDAFDFPRWVYDINRKAFRQEDHRRSLMGSRDDRLAMFHNRFNMIHQRIMRNDLFSQPLLPTDELRRDYHKLTPIDALLGSRDEVQTVLGMLTQPREGHFCLEDTNCSVPIDLSAVNVSMMGLFTENCIIIAQGRLCDGVFRVQEMGFPPAESRAHTLDTVAVIGTSGDCSEFSGVGVRNARERAELEQLEAERDDAFVCALSDVRLDDPRVFEKMRQLLDGFDDSPPDVLVLIGNFSSDSEEHPVQRLRADMDRLAALFAGHNAIVRHTHLVFVPGPHDPGGSTINALPRAKLPRVVTRGFGEIVPDMRVSFATNPCRLRYCTQEIVIFRSNLVNKMRRNCIVAPHDQMQQAELSQHLVKTILDESHLSPLPLHVQPIHWNYDHCLQLYPSPHVVIVADNYGQFEHTYGGCVVINPGSFPTDFGFISYRPQQRDTDFCRMDGFDDDDDDEEDESDSESARRSDEPVAVEDGGTVEESDSGDSGSGSDAGATAQPMEEDDAVPMRIDGDNTFASEWPTFKNTETTTTTTTVAAGSDDDEDEDDRALAEASTQDQALLAEASTQDQALAEASTQDNEAAGSSDEDDSGSSSGGGGGGASSSSASADAMSEDEEE